MKKRLLAAGLCLAVCLALGGTARAEEGGGYAWPSDEMVRVDDAVVNLHMFALLDENGYATNYARIRDVAYIMSGTGAQFEVGYYNGLVHVVTGWDYTATGSELAKPFEGAQVYSRMLDRTDVNGQMLPLEAIRLTDVNGNGYTYYKLRDLGAYLGFVVSWSPEEGVILSAPTAG